MNHLVRALWGWLRVFFDEPPPKDTAGTTTHPTPSTPPAMKHRAKCFLRIPRRLLEQMKADLCRPHAFAHERVGFLLVREAEGQGGRLLLAWSYEPLREDEYIKDPSVGARINRAAIRRMLTLALAGESIFHIHLHLHSGMPTFSTVDEENLRELVPSFCGAAPRSIHGALLLSNDQGLAWGWQAGRGAPFPVSSITIVGTPLLRWEVQT